MVESYLPFQPENSGRPTFSCHVVFANKLISDVQLFILQSLELWNMIENKTMTLAAHEGLIAALAVSNVTRMVASASHDKFVKLWK